MAAMVSIVKRERFQGWIGGREFVRRVITGNVSKNHSGLRGHNEKKLKKIRWKRKRKRGEIEKLKEEEAELARINSSALAFCCPEGAVFG
jgi:hypothetical protein